MDRALVLKHGNLLSQRDGDVPAGNHAYRLYFHDCRFLDELALRIDNLPGVVLYTINANTTATIMLSNPDIQWPDVHSLAKQSLAITRRMTLSDRLLIALEVRNVTAAPIDTMLTLSARAHFDDMFAIRGHPSKQCGTLHEPEYAEGVLTLRYDGADRHMRTTALTFDPPPAAHDGTTARYSLHFAPQTATTLCVAVTIADHQPADDHRRWMEYAPVHVQAFWHECHTGVTSPFHLAQVTVGDP
jgi:hypothetical protein